MPRRPPPPGVVTREGLDAMQAGHAAETWALGRVQIAPKCHPGEAFRVSYFDGFLRLVCHGCDSLVFDVEVPIGGRAGK